MVLYKSYTIPIHILLDCIRIAIGSLIYPNGPKNWITIDPFVQKVDTQKVDTLCHTVSTLLYWAWDVGASPALGHQMTSKWLTLVDTHEDIMKAVWRQRCIYIVIILYLWRRQRWWRWSKMYLWRRRCIYEGVSADEDVFMKAKMMWRCIYEGVRADEDVFMSFWPCDNLLEAYINDQTIITLLQPVENELVGQLLGPDSLFSHLYNQPWKASKKPGRTTWNWCFSFEKWTTSATYHQAFVFAGGCGVLSKPKRVLKQHLLCSQQNVSTRTCRTWRNLYLALRFVGHHHQAPSVSKRLFLVSQPCPWLRRLKEHISSGPGNTSAQWRNSDRWSRNHCLRPGLQLKPAINLFFDGVHLDFFL